MTARTRAGGLAVAMLCLVGCAGAPQGSADGPGGGGTPSVRPSGSAEPSPDLTPEPLPSPSTAPPDTPAPSPAPTIPTSGDGEFQTVGGTVPAQGPGRVLTYRVEIEGGLPFAPDALAATVHETLTDDRGWQPIEDVAFERTTRGDAELQLLVASPDTTDALCQPLDTGGELSCRVGERVVLNGLRWATGVPHFGGQLALYRQYLVNHEVGHALGYGHVSCGGSGEPASVMQQQSIALDGCEANPWPSVTRP